MTRAAPSTSGSEWPASGRSLPRPAAVNAVLMTCGYEAVAFMCGWLALTNVWKGSGRKTSSGYECFTRQRSSRGLMSRVLFDSLVEHRGVLIALPHQIPTKGGAGTRGGLGSG